MAIFFTQENIVSLIVVVILASVYVLGHQFVSIRREYRAEWLSFSGGVSIAYVFMHLLPELSIMLKKLPPTMPVEWLGIIEGYRVYILALLGFSAFYGLDRFVHYSFEKKSDQSDISSIKRGKFRIYLIGFILYNVLIGYMIVQEATNSVIALILVCVVMSFHFLLISHSFETKHSQYYHLVPRLVLAGSVVLGWIFAMVTDLPDRVNVILFTFVIGAIIVNTIKEEVPGGSESRFLPFLVGVIVTTIVILLIYSHLGH